MLRPMILLTNSAAILGLHTRLTRLESGIPFHAAFATSGPLQGAPKSVIINNQLTLPLLSSSEDYLGSAEEVSPFRHVAISRSSRS